MTDRWVVNSVTFFYSLIADLILSIKLRCSHWCEWLNISCTMLRFSMVRGSRLETLNSSFVLVTICYQGVSSLLGVWDRMLSMWLAFTSISLVVWNIKTELFGLWFTSFSTDIFILNGHWVVLNDKFVNHHRHRSIVMFKTVNLIDIFLTL